MAGRFPLLRDHEVLAEVGRGTLGVVYKVLGGRSHELAALKYIETREPELRRWIKRAFRAAQALEHPSLVRPRQLGEEENALHLVSDLAEGKTVLDFLGPPVGGDADGLRRAFYLFGQLLKTLSAIHAAGLVHRGVKPTNLLVTRDARLRVTDVGLTRERRLEELEALPSDAQEQAQYSAPEQLLARPADRRADLYAVGLLLYEALSGRFAHDGGTAAARALARTRTEALPLALGEPVIDESFGPVLARLLAREPDARPGSAEEAFRELRHAWDRYNHAVGRAAAALQANVETVKMPIPAALLGDLTPARGLPAGIATGSVSTAELRISDLHISEVLAQSDPDAFPRFSPILVGRETELHRLEEALDAARAGRGRLVALYGEAGVGKTLLLGELAGAARAQGAVVIVGRGAESRRAPRGPIIAMLDALASRLRRLTPPERDQLLPPEASALSEISESFASFLPSDLPSEAPAGDAEYAAARRKYRLRVALVGLLRRLAERNPIVLILEDLDVADHETIDLASHLVRTLYGAAEGERPPLMLLVSYRSDEVDDRHRLSLELRQLADAHLVRPLELDRLDEAATGRLVASLLGLETAPPTLVDYVRGETKGNPLFVVETVSWLREEGVLSYRAGQVRLDEERLRQVSGEGARGAPRSMPHALIEVVNRRLGRLGPQALEVLRTGAIAGHEFRLDFLKNAIGLAEADLLDAVAELIRTRFLVSPPERPGVLAFDHAKVRDVVLGGIARDARKEIAGRVARALEALLGARRNESASELASLYDEAGDAGKSIEYLPVAAEHHFREGDLRGALKRWRRVAEVLARLDEKERGLHFEIDFEARKKTARLLSLLGQLELARRLYGDLIDRAHASRRPIDEVDARNGFAEVTGKIGDFEGARRASQEALQRAMTTAHAAGQATALENLGVIARRTFQHKEATQHFRDALKIRKNLGDDVGVARGLSNLGLVFRNQDNYERAIAHFEEAREIYERLHDRLGLAVTLSHLAGVHQRKNEYSRAVELYREARRHDQDIGNTRGAALSNQGMGYVFLEEGDYRGALEHFERALGVFEHVGDRQNAAFALINLGHTYYRTGNHKEAAKRYKDALGVLQEIGNPVAESEARSGLGLALAALGEKAAAIEQANRAVEAARANGARDKEAWARHTLAQVTGSREQAELALSIAEIAGNANLIFQVHHTLARLALERDDRESAREHIQKAFTMIDLIAERAGPAKETFLKKPAVEAVFRDAQRL